MLWSIKFRVMGEGRKDGGGEEEGGRGGRAGREGGRKQREREDGERQRPWERAEWEEEEIHLEQLRLIRGLELSKRAIIRTVCPNGNTSDMQRKPAFLSSESKILTRQKKDQVLERLHPGATTVEPCLWSLQPASRLPLRSSPTYHHVWAP